MVGTISSAVRRWVAARDCTREQVLWPPADVRPDLLSEAEENALFDVWKPLAASLPAAPARLSGADVERLAATLAEPLHAFFEKVYVNADDAAVRANRHALLREIDATLLRFADLCRVVRKQR